MCLCECAVASCSPDQCTCLPWEALRELALHAQARALLSAIIIAYMPESLSALQSQAAAWCLLECATAGTALLLYYGHAAGMGMAAHRCLFPSEVRPMKAGCCTAPLIAAALCLFETNQDHPCALILSYLPAFSECGQDSGAMGAKRVPTVPVKKQSTLPCSAALQSCRKLYYDRSLCASEAAHACEASRSSSSCSKFKKPFYQGTLIWNNILGECTLTGSRT